MKPKCLWCGAEAVRFCDALIGVEPKGAVRGESGEIVDLLAGLKSDLWTCDAPMCAKHVKQVGLISGSAPDSIDYCPLHVVDERDGLKDLFMFESEVEARRREIYASALRSRLRCVCSKGTS